MRNSLDKQAKISPATDQNNSREILAMINPQKVWVKWVEKKKRYEVGFYWEQKRYRFYSWTLRGKRIPFKSKDIAEEFASQIRSDMRPNRKGVITFDPAPYTGDNKKSVYTISEHSKLWLKEYFLQIQTEGISKEYYQHLERYFRLHINPILGDIDIRELNEPTIKRFYLSLYEKGLGKKMVQNLMDTLKKFIHDSFQEKVIYEMIRFPKYKNKKHEKKKKRKWLTEEQQDKILSFVPDQHKPMVMCGLYHGLRQQEVRNIKRQDINWKDGTMTVDTLKGGNPREILLEPALLELIKKIPPTLEHNFLFHYGPKRKPYKKNYQWRIFREALDKAGFKDITPKDACRHSHASQLLRRGASTRHAQQILGHTDIRTTEIYTHVLTSDQAKFQRGGSVEKFGGGQVVAK